MLDTLRAASCPRRKIDRAWSPGHAALNPHALGRGKDSIFDVAGIANARGLKAENFSLLVGTGAVLHTTRHEATLARTHFHDIIAELDPETPFPD
jgi:hypothetical protein